LKSINIITEMKELCIHPNALFRFLRDRITAKIVNRSARQDLSEISLGNGFVIYKQDVALEQDITMRKGEQLERYFYHLRQGTLTRQWEKYGSKHQNELIKISLENRTIS
jgi:hypothetical protein